MDATLVRTGEIAFPTRRAVALTPETTPALRVPQGGFPAYLTQIEARRDGSIDVTIGLAQRVTQSRPEPLPATPGDQPDFVVRTDPITGRSVKLYVGPPGEGPALPLPVPHAGEKRR